MCQDKVYLVYITSERHKDESLQCIFSKEEDARAYVDEHNSIEKQLVKLGALNVTSAFFVEGQVDNFIGKKPRIAYEVIYDKYLEGLYCDYYVLSRGSLDEICVDKTYTNDKFFCRTVSMISREDAINKLNSICNTHFTTENLDNISFK